MDVLKGLKTQNVLGKGGITGKKAVIDIQVKQEAHVNLDADYWAATAAKAIATAATTNMLQGLTPGGKPLPPVKPSTARRRKYRAEQHTRGGYPKIHWGAKAKGRNRKLKKAEKSKQNLARRYQPKGPALQAQGPYAPNNGPHSGNESGLLARSIAVEHSQSLPSFTSPKPERTESTFRVFFADVRAMRDGHGSSAVDRTAATGALDFTGVMDSPSVKGEIQATADEAVQRDEKDTLKMLKKLIDSLKQTSAAVQSIG
jgi:hypothetical protein